MEATPGFEPGVKALQASALPLGHVAVWGSRGTLFRAQPPPTVKKPTDGRSTGRLQQSMERTTGFEPATPTLARWCSTS